MWSQTESFAQRLPEDSLKKAVQPQMDADHHRWVLEMGEGEVPTVCLPESGCKLFAIENPDFQKPGNQSARFELYSFVMDPLSPNDPLHVLLGKARPVEPRSNFTQNVLREIRQTPQALSLWERVRVWLGEWGMPRMAFAGAVAALVVTAWAMFAWQRPDPQTPMVAVQPTVVPRTPTVVHTALHEVSASMILAATAEVSVAPVSTVVEEKRDPMEVLFVQQDTSALSDTELALLVY
jgi:hypothetical protein